MSGSPRSVLVIGAGVQGLTTGVVLAESGWSVHIRTTDHPEGTTSGAGGAMWGATCMRPAHRAPAWGAEALRTFLSLAEDECSGVHMVPGTMAARYSLGPSMPPDVRMMPDLRRCKPEELPEGFVSGYRVTAPVVDMPRYLDHLVGRLRAAGGELSVDPVPSLAEAARHAPVVVNCAGIGALELAEDPDVYPVRGQTVVVRNPGIDEYFVELTGGSDYVACIPHGSRLVLEGVAINHDWHRVVSSDITERILSRCAAIEPKISEVEVLEERTGLRPARSLIRLDSEVLHGATVVHNYGHERSGISLSWGCASEVRRLVSLADEESCSPV